MVDGGYMAYYSSDFLLRQLFRQQYRTDWIRLNDYLFWHGTWQWRHHRIQSHFLYLFAELHTSLPTFYRRQYQYNHAIFGEWLAFHLIDLNKITLNSGIKIPLSGNSRQQSTVHLTFTKVFSPAYSSFSHKADKSPGRAPST